MNQLQLFKQNVEMVRKTLQGWCTPEKSNALLNYILETKPKVCVEIGVFGGSSAVPIAMALQVVGNGKLYAIDSWETSESIVGMEDANLDWWSELDHEKIYVGFVNALVKYDLTKYCIPLKFTSEKASVLFDKIDFIHIDGNHSSLKSWLDVELYYSKVNSGGIIVFDDIGWREKNATGTKKAVDFLNENCEILEDVGDCRFYRKK